MSDSENKNPPKLRSLKDRWLVPPGRRFFYQVPETNAFYENHVFDNLVIEVREHYVKNSLAVPKDLVALIEHYMCTNLPDGFCTGAPTRKKHKFISLHQVRNFTRVLSGVGVSALKGESRLVPHDESERRAAICANCSEYNDRRLCTTCNGLGPFMRRLLGVHRTTSKDAVLGACGVCKCLLQVKIHITPEILSRTVETNEYPDHCWMKEICDAE